MNENYFKKKTKKGPIKDNRKTIEKIHKEKMEYFEKLQKSLPKLNRDLQKLEKEMEKERNKKDSEKRNDELDTKIQELKSKIKSIENKDEEIDYHFNTLGILNKYFTLKEAETEAKVEAEAEAEVGAGEDQKYGIFKFIKSDKNEEKMKICKEYMQVVCPDEYNNIDECDVYTCDDCNESLIDESARGDMVCENCAKVYTNLPMEFYRVPYKDSQDLNFTKKFAYERINHFKEWIQRFQAKENTKVPDEIIEKLRVEIKKERIKDLKKINKSKIRKWLKKIGENKYYEHEDNIINRLNGVKPLQMNSKQEEQLCYMFKKIQEPFEKYKPKERKNFLSFPYTIYKFCELLEWDEYLPCFRLLKSDEKLYEQDQIWKKICADPDILWEYWPTLNDS